MNGNNHSNFPPVVIIGSGGHAQVLIDCLHTIGREIMFCAEVESEQFGTTVTGVLVRGPEEIVFDLDRDKVQLINGLGSVGKPSHRQIVYERFKKQGFEFASVIHPSATVANLVTIGDGVQIMANAVVQTGSIIGSNTLINTTASIDHQCRIADHCHIAPGVILSGEVSIGQCSHIGTGSSVIQGINIGQECVIGAGATVLKNLPANTTAVGTPAKPISPK